MASPLQPEPAPGRSYRRHRTRIGPRDALGLLLGAVLVAGVLVWPAVRDEEGRPPVGTAATGAMFRGNPAHTGEAPGPGPVVEPQLRWRVQTGGVLYAAPVVAGGLVYVANSDVPDGMVFAIDAVDGSIAWQVEANDIFATPAVAGGMVFLGGVNVSALDARTGQERWTFEPEGVVYASPAVVDGVVYAGTGDGEVFALDAAGGDLVWRAKLDRSVRASPAVDGGSVYLHVAGGVLALDAASGQERWRVPVGSPGNGPWPGSPAVADGVVYVAGWLESPEVAAPGEVRPVLLALDAATGAERWRFDHEGYGFRTFGSTPAVVGGKVYLAARQFVHALDAATGREHWRVGLGSVGSDPTVAAGVLYLTTGGGSSAHPRGTVLALDAETGARLWRYETMDALGTAPAVADRFVYVASYHFQSNDGLLYAFWGAAASDFEATPGASPAASPPAAVAAPA